MTTVNISALLTKTREEEDATVGANQAKSGVCSIAKSPFSIRNSYGPTLHLLSMNFGCQDGILNTSKKWPHSSQDKVNKTESSANYKNILQLQ